jgi:phosphoglycolate phosphatase
MIIRAILFDVDDTLIHYTERATKWHIKAAKELGLRIPTAEEFKHAWGLPWDSLIKKLWPGASVEGFKEAYKKASGGKRVRAVEGVLAALKKLKDKQMVLGIVTSRSAESLRKRLCEAGIPPEYFSRIITEDGSVFHKPHPKVLRPALGELKKQGIALNEVLYVGDTIIDLEVAKKNRVKFAGVLTGNFNEREFRKAGAKNVLKSAADLPAFLEHNGLV